MNRKNLTAAVLAGLAGVAGIAGTAQAVNLNPDGTGQVLLYPYYTTNDGNQTLISVVNTTDQAKAVKVRFLEGFNSREVLDFNLYLSPFDVWVAAITRDPAAPESGGAIVAIADNSCTVRDDGRGIDAAGGRQRVVRRCDAGSRGNRHVPRKDESRLGDRSGEHDRNRPARCRDEQPG